MADLTRLTYVFLFMICLGLSIRDIGLFADSSSEKEIPTISKVGFKNVGPTLKFLYCYSCGYRKVFDDYVTIIQQKYPQISVHGSNYDPPGVSLQFARFLSIAKMVIIFAIMTGSNPFQFLGHGNAAPPNWWVWCVENKLYSCLMCFFLTNAIEGQMMSTGAFEITLDDMPVWSKIETGRIPQPPELFQIIDNHLGLQFESKLDLNTGFTK
ncbi:thioredoxin reductase-like selenoprotein T homolog CG3887 [Thrips palmi]|uniref:Thioredoxin reductase-like selenoprotein T homolog CG3887 n=1 Tax=Thrips palmi TaxID=161013 RepID=A0A6P9A1W6_THRPL|nr:thioredoxin reductase-like selenoprotein T homolog CG3887 [Thrips palmi]